MKTRIISVAILIVILSVVAVGCITPQDVVRDCVSHLEEELLLGAIDGYEVELTVGEAETTPTVDGIAGSRQPFIKITLTPTVTGAIDKTVKFRYASIDGELNRAATRYTLETTLSTSIVEQSLSLTIDGITLDVPLTDVTEGYLSATDALTIANKDLADALSGDISEDGTLSREVHIRLMRDNLGTKPFYYYVAMLKSTDDCIAVLIDPETKSVVARKT